MSIYTFTNPLTGQRFEVETPATFTEAQARQIFEQQLSAGSLVGFKPGDVLSSATQLAGGLKSAASQVTQTLSGVAGSVTGAIPGSQLLAASQSVASRTLSGITTSITNLVPTNPINVADLAKQATSLVPIQNLSQVDVRAAMSQAAALANQAANVVSNDKGLGQFGLDATQLERAGVLKPGTASTYLANGTANLTSVLNSPAVWTGVNGITSVDSLLSSPAAQNLIQQDLMSQGLDAVQNLGIPTGSLAPAALAGTALNAAKSVTDTMSWAKGLPLSSDIKSLYDQTARAGAFAVDFVSSAVNDAVLQQDSPDPAANTADRDTIDAAVTRITGNDKIPAVNYGSVESVSIKAEFTQRFSADVTNAQASFKELNLRSAELARVSTNSDLSGIINTIDQLELLQSDYLALEGTLLSLERQGRSYEQRYDALPPLYSILETVNSQIQQSIKNIEAYIQRLQARIAVLNSRQ